MLTIIALLNLHLTTNYTYFLMYEEDILYGISKDFHMVLFKKKTTPPQKKKEKKKKKCILWGTSITWGSWHLKSLTIWRFVQQFVWVTTKENINASCYWSFVRRNNQATVDSPHKGPAMHKVCFKSWHHNQYTITKTSARFIFVRYVFRKSWNVIFHD